jgi:hypothetical protein
VEVAVSELARFDNRGEMQRASERFVQALTGCAKPEPQKVENIAEPRLKCGHDAKHRYGKSQCRVCRQERQRAYYLKTAVETTRAKLARLEREARERGQVV